MSDGDVDVLLGAGDLFDEQPVEDLTRGFLGAPGHHCLVAFEDGRPVGFVTGIEIRHPDKATEMLLYELGVDAQWRRRGIGRALTEALRDLAARRGMRGMWVLTDPDNVAALATYRRSGADVEETSVVLEWRFDDT